MTMNHIILFLAVFSGGIAAIVLGEVYGFFPPVSGY